MSRLKNVLLKLGLVCFGLIAGLAASEVALKVLHHFKHGSEFENIDDIRQEMLSGGDQKKGTVSLGEIVQPNPADKIIYDLRPNLDLTFQRAHVRTNSLGMRGPEIDMVKAAGVFRIVILGDSFAFGWGVEENETFAYALETNLNRLSNGNPKFEVVNIGVPGYSTFQEVERFIVMKDCLSADAVLVYFVQNDFGMPFFVRDVQSGSGGILTSFEFSRLSWRALNPRYEEEKMKLQGWDPNHSMDQLASVTKEMGIPLYFTINPRKSWKRDLSRIPSIRHRPGVYFIPLREGLLKAMKDRNIPEEALTLSFDPHPSPIRHKILGDLMTPWFMWAISSAQ